MTTVLETSSLFSAARGGITRKIDTAKTVISDPAQREQFIKDNAAKLGTFTFGVIQALAATGFQLGVSISLSNELHHHQGDPMPFVALGLGYLGAMGINGIQNYLSLTDERMNGMSIDPYMHAANTVQKTVLNKIPVFGNLFDSPKGQTVLAGLGATVMRVKNLGLLAAATHTSPLDPIPIVSSLGAYVPGTLLLATESYLLRKSLDPGSQVGKVVNRAKLEIDSLRQDTLYSLFSRKV